jgi:hypothetical protein
MGGTVLFAHPYAFMAWTGTALLLNDNHDGGGDNDNDKYNPFSWDIILHIPYVVTME